MTVQTDLMPQNGGKFVYLNNAAGAYPLAPGVVEAVAETMNRPPHISGRDATVSQDSAALCRKQLAEIMKVDSRGVVLTPSATYGLNAALLGLGLKQGDLVITTVMEHNSVLRPLTYLRERYGVRVECVPLGKDASLDCDVLYELLNEKPRLVVMTHASNVTGRINPVDEWFLKAKTKGAYTLLDASQTFGRVSVIPALLNADMVVFPGYKALGGPMGTGVLYVSCGVRVEPVFTGGTGIRSDSLEHPSDMPLSLEAGTPNMHAFAGLSAALRHYAENAPIIAEKDGLLLKKLYKSLSSIPGIRLFDENLENRIPIVSFKIEGMGDDLIAFALEESFGVKTRAGLHCAPLMHKALGVSSTIRLSPSYNTPLCDIDYTADAIRMAVM